MYKQMKQSGVKPANFKEIWMEWLWKTDCIAKLMEGCGDMNHMHVLGVLISFMEALEPPPGEQCLHVLLSSVPLVHLYQKPISSYTQRELTTQLECLQLSWGCILSHCDFEKVSETLRRLMARFGVIAHHAFPEKQVLDDQQYTTPIPGSGMLIATRKYIRQMVCIFLSLFR